MAIRLAISFSSILLHLLTSANRNMRILGSKAKSKIWTIDTGMRFRDYILKEGPMDMGGGMGGDPMAGGGMGAPPMGMDPMGGGMGGQPEPPPVPSYADVWDVLDSILNQKPLEHEQQQQQAQQQAEEQPLDPNAGMMPPEDPTGAGQGMGGEVPGGAGTPPMGGPPMPAGPHLMS